MLVLGIDEVGRGCLAGPLVVGAVGLDTPIPGITDSKLLSRKQREHYAELIYAKAAYTGLGWISAEELDYIGLSNSLKLASERALESFNLSVDRIVLDGNYNYLKGVCAAETIIKADLSIPAVSAASIIAKVARDNYMIKLSEQYPLYKFESHVGYGTAAHIEALRNHGACEHHRKSFEPLKSMLSVQTVEAA